jgi:hypothetical protein
LIASFPEQPKRRRSTRPDRLRKTAVKAIAQVQCHLDEGTIDLPLNKASQLWALLSDAKHALQQPRPKAVNHPSLRAAAQLLALCGIPLPELLLDIASAVAIECDESTARRYLAAASSPRRI